MALPLRPDRIGNTVTDVDQMVSDTFQTGNKGRIIRADIHIAFALGKTRKMAGNQLLFHCIDTLLQLCQRRQTVTVQVFKRILGDIEHFHHAVAHIHNLAARLFGEGNLLSDHFNADFVEILRMVTDALQVIEDMEVRADDTLVTLLDIDRQTD